MESNEARPARTRKWRSLKETSVESSQGAKPKRPPPLPQQPMQSSGFNTRAMMEYDSKKRSVVLAYVLLIFLGFLGLHRLYVGQKSGLIMLGLFVAGWLLAIVLWGTLFHIILILWILIDLFLLYGYVEDYNSRLIDRINR